MAGDWIKVEISTPDKPEIFRIARFLGVKDRDMIFGKLMRLWIWFDRNSVDGVVDGMVSTDVDDLMTQERFMEALKSVKWCDFDDQKERIWLLNFDRHNGETAKKRALKNRRQTKYRKGSGKNVDTPASTSASTREEKRREEKSNLSLTKKDTIPKVDTATGEIWGVAR